MLFDPSLNWVSAFTCVYRIAVTWNFVGVYRAWWVFLSEEKILKLFKDLFKDLTIVLLFCLPRIPLIIRNRLDVEENNKNLLGFYCQGFQEPCMKVLIYESLFIAGFYLTILEKSSFDMLNFFIGIVVIGNWKWSV